MGGTTDRIRGCSGFSEGCPSQTASSGAGDYDPEVIEQIPTKYVEDFIPLETVNAAVERIAGSSIDDTYQSALAAWKETWQRKQSGIPDKTLFDLEDDQG